MYPSASFRRSQRKVTLLVVAEALPVSCPLVYLSTLSLEIHLSASFVPGFGPGCVTSSFLTVTFPSERRITTNCTASLFSIPALTAIAVIVVAESFLIVSGFVYFVPYLVVG